MILLLLLLVGCAATPSQAPTMPTKTNAVNVATLTPQKVVLPPGVVIWTDTDGCWHSIIRGKTNGPVCPTNFWALDDFIYPTNAADFTWEAEQSEDLVNWVTLRHCNSNTSGPLLVTNNGRHMNFRMKGTKINNVKG